jgi:hypothetical protein
MLVPKHLLLWGVAMSTANCNIMDLAYHWLSRGRRGRDRMVVGFPTTVQSVLVTTNVVRREFSSWRGVLDTTLCDKVCQWLPTGWWVAAGTPVSSMNKMNRHDITEILLKVALSTINQTKPLTSCFVTFLIPDLRFHQFLFICVWIKIKSSHETKCSTISIIILILKSKHSYLIT